MEKVNKGQSFINRALSISSERDYLHQQGYVFIHIYLFVSRITQKLLEFSSWD